MLNFQAAFAHEDHVPQYVVAVNQVCEELPHVLTALMTRERNINSRIAMSELRSLVSDNEVDRLRMQQGNSVAEGDKRCDYNPTVKRTIVQGLQMFLHQNNNLVNMFKIALNRMPSDSHKIQADKTPVGEYTRRFNSPTIGEVAVVIVGENLQSKDIVLQRRNNDLKRVSEIHRTYDALQYPLVFWQGEDGYHFNIKMNIEQD
ncbi:hypothetical protein EVAR_10677_1 [Eumeta japonica]|uniref:Helitron helicase-like domain-containing protein n=1 Tax=Eumeta variegata TaxID=151549 RepID=A0A4C1U7T5_EUMVA|nr:hypothetical protein EVAR_10677_1 [Eumeta japonica]